MTIRVDDGVTEGGEVSMFYDPMIAKLITHAPTRLGAIDAQIAALDAFEIEGPGNNIDFLSALMQHPRFAPARSPPASSPRNIPTASTARPRRPSCSARSPPSPPPPPPRRPTAPAASTASLGRKLAPPSDWMATIGKTDYAVAVSTDGITVDGTPLDLAMDYTPGDRLVEVETLYDDDDADGEGTPPSRSR